MMDPEKVTRKLHLPQFEGSWSSPENSAAWHHLRARHLTSTDIPTLMGIERYQKRSTLMKLKLACQVARRKQNGRMSLGHAHEADTAARAARTLGLEASPMREFITLQHPDLPVIGLASSYDWKTFERYGSTPWGIAPLEAKLCHVMAFVKGSWRTSGHQITWAGDYVEMQLQAQMLVGGFPFCRLSVKIQDPKLPMARWPVVTGTRRAEENTQRAIWRAAEIFNEELAWRRRKEHGELALVGVA